MLIDVKGRISKFNIWIVKFRKWYKMVFAKTIMIEAGFIKLCSKQDVQQESSVTYESKI